MYLFVNRCELKTVSVLIEVVFFFQFMNAISYFSGCIATCIVSIVAAIPVCRFVQADDSFGHQILHLRGDFTDAYAVSPVVA